jgi:hypothetical protein
VVAWPACRCRVAEPWRSRLRHPFPHRSPYLPRSPGGPPPVGYARFTRYVKKRKPYDTIVGRLIVRQYSYFCDMDATTAWARG